MRVDPDRVVVNVRAIAELPLDQHSAQRIGGSVVYTAPEPEQAVVAVQFLDGCLAFGETELGENCRQSIFVPRPLRQNAD